MPNEDNAIAQDYCQEFIAQARDARTIWGLWSEAYGWASADSDEDFEIEVILFWADQESAEKHMQDEWREYDLIAIPLDEFIGKILAELKDQSVLVGPNWDTDFIGLEISPATLIEQLGGSVEEDQ